MSWAQDLIKSRSVVHDGPLPTHFICITRFKEEMQPAEMQQRCLITKCMQHASLKIPHIINRNTGIPIQVKTRGEQKMNENNRLKLHGFYISALVIG